MSVRATVLAFLLATTIRPVDLSGTWVIDLLPDFSGHETSIDCTIDQDAQKLTIRCGDAPPFTGEIVERRVTWQFKTGRNGEVTVTFAGEVDESGTRIDGTWRFPAPENRDGKFTARRSR